MYVLYSLTLTFAFLVLLPYFAYKVLVSRKYSRNLSERLGSLPAELSIDSRPSIWVHAVSVGEALAAIPLLVALRSRYGDYRIIVSTTTETGQAVARSRLLSADGYCYFPFDWRWTASRTMDVIKPHLVVLMESELWPNFLRVCRERAVPVLVANGRISERSFQRSRRLRIVAKLIYRQVSHFAMQGEADAQRARALGAPEDRVSICGNLKYDTEASADESQGLPIAALAQMLGASQTPVVIAGSTAEGEEELIIAAFKKLQQTPGLEHAQLLIAPRHPERFEGVAQMLARSGLAYLRRSSLPGVSKGSSPVPTVTGDADLTGQTASVGKVSFDAILLDSMGELSGLFGYASVVFIGGSLVPKGGHNILEPASNRRPIIVGPYMDNFRDITDSFLKRGAVVQLPHLPAGEMVLALAQTLRMILLDPEYASRLGTNARNAVDANKGATRRVMTIVETLLNPVKTQV